mgnify:CR=1 FL=1
MKKQEIEILLVEDNKSDAEMTLRALKKINLINTVVHVSDGEKALDFLYAKGEFSERDPSVKPKVILLDIKMPKINGLEVLEKVKANPLTKHIPVVMLTSSQEDPDIERCYELGANSYIVKPVGFPEFVKTVSELGMYWVIYNHT